ncbi:transposase [Paenibacillus larvae]|nr:transposase [Paenibacillus larvae]
MEADRYERTENRKAYRNGSYPHGLHAGGNHYTKCSACIRGGKFTTELFSRYQRSEQALILAMMEMVVNGVSTRKVSQVTEELCGNRVF